MFKFRLAACIITTTSPVAAHPNMQVDGILVQLPLPKHINEQTVLDAISIDKDVDGFHPMNIGSLAMRGRNPLFVSCTPKVRKNDVEAKNFNLVSPSAGVVRFVQRSTV